ncbi:helix-turn-helix transcriptional regulator [Mesobacillus subterraneus]|uniref:helix-turn-helix domain-containing protein n=1 Tax=Mesobacillus subterraneus TaxID=285983 RepID=UPI001CFD0680|nr:helix-turn-helix transcriptional regulator [Mesobacillus subterraneus]WLR54273.1 helix-turn-helix transcriptional regulator [Mesobacillus subterraneus]
MHPESLGAILRMERFKRNLTQEQVCKALQMKSETLSKIENNKSVNGKTIKRLIDFYELENGKAPFN